jgi:hypothetical protein
MKRSWKDLAATILVAAVAVPYIGYLVRGSMPFVEDPRGMAAVGLLLGAVAAAVLGREAFRGSRLGRVATVVGVGSLGVGIATLVWAESGTVSDVLLAVFMGTIGVAWALVMLGDVALSPGGHRRTLAHR